VRVCVCSAVADVRAAREADVVLVKPFGIAAVLGVVSDLA
jgi:hypothetical protein